LEHISWLELWSNFAKLLRNAITMHKTWGYSSFINIFSHVYLQLSVFPLRSMCVGCARAQCEFDWVAHAYLLSKQLPFEYFEARKYQTLEGFFSQLCTCFAWGATDSDKVSFYLFIHVKIT
jgi:hypothetical protein